MAKFEIHVGTYIINFLSLFHSVRLFLKGSNARMPFIVNRKGFINIPQPKKFYIIEQDGVGGEWFAHDNTFTNVVEDNRVSFHKTPAGALMDFIHEHDIGSKQSNNNRKKYE